MNSLTPASVETTAHTHPRYDICMHLNFATVLVATAVAVSIYLLLNKSDRMFPTIATIASGLELLLAMHLMSMSLAKFRIDVILPGLLVVCGAICWGRSSEKGNITSSTALLLIGAIQLMLALHLV